MLVKLFGASMLYVLLLWMLPYAQAGCDPSQYQVTNQAVKPYADQRWCSGDLDPLMCRQCEAETHVERCGCVLELRDSHTTFCSIGMCIPNACVPGQYMFRDLLTVASDSGRVRVTNENNVIVPSLEWTMECRTCDACPSYKRRVKLCDGNTHSTECGDCPVGQYCNGIDSFDCEVGYYCIDGVRSQCNAAEAQVCDRENMTTYEVGCRAGNYFENYKCVPCPAGSYLQASGTHTQTRCTPCPAGTKNSEMGSESECIACLPGRYAEAQAVECTECAPGTYQENSGASECKQCNAGQYSVSITGGCQLCMAGRYSSTVGQSTCKECEVGTYNERMGASACVACAKNLSTCTRSEVNDLGMQCQTGRETGCEYCPRGYVVCDKQLGDACDCDGCTKQFHCMECPPGYYCPGENRRIPHAMAVIGFSFTKSVGTRETDAVVHDCTVCGAEEYVQRQCTGRMDRQCAPCSTAQVMKTYVQAPCNATHNTRLLECGDQVGAGSVCNPCPPGSMLVNAQCEACAPNTFNEAWNGTCRPCANNQVSGPGASQCTRECGEGMYAPDGMVCQSASEGVQRVVARATRLPIVHGAVWVSVRNCMAVISNSAVGTMWMLDEGREWLAAGGGRGDGVGSAAGLGVLVKVVEQDGEMVACEEGGRIVRLTYMLEMEMLKVETMATVTGKKLGGIMALTHMQFLVTDTTQHAVWRISSSTIPLLVRGGGGRYTGSEKGLYSRPTELVRGLESTHVLVLDEYGISRFDLDVANTQESVRVCGGGNQWQLQRGQAVECTELNFGQMGVTSMASGRMGGEWNVVWAWRGGVARWNLQDGRVWMLASDSHLHVFFSGTRLFATKCMEGQCEGVEIATATCLCNKGLYCDKQCLQAGVGTFAPSWSTHTISCRAGTVGQKPGQGTHEEACSSEGGDFTTHGEGRLAWEKTCAFLFDVQRQTCVEGCNASQYMVKGVCKPCPRGTRSTGNKCELCLPGTWAKDNGTCTPCPANQSTLFAGAFRCMEDECADGGTRCVHGSVIKIVDRATDMDRVGETIYMATGNAVWAAVGEQVHKVVEGEFRFGLLQVDEEERFVLSTAAEGGRCIWKTNLSSGQSVVLAGQCQVSGDKDGSAEVATFYSIEALAYMHVDGRTPVLFVSARVGECAAVRAVSLFDGSVSTFASADDGRVNRRMLSGCWVGRLGLKVARGSDQVHMYHEQAGLVRIANDGVYATEVLYVQQNYAIRDMCIKGTEVGLLVNEGKSLKRLLADGSMELIEEDHGDFLECGGLRYWVGSVGGEVRLVVRRRSQEPQGCADGFVQNVQGVCMQVGVGYYANAAEGVVACKSGTWGSRAGAWSHTLCLPCTPGTVSGEGAFGCHECPAEKPWGWRDVCVMMCPAGTFQGEQGQCTSCPGGWSSMEGASACHPCEAGTYANAQTQGLCTPCAAGFTSIVGAHHCVVMCGWGQYSVDGVKCKTPTENWKMLTSIEIQGVSMRAVTVGAGGLVFYSNGNSLSYFLDDCVEGGTSVECKREGVDLLQWDGMDLGISSLAMDNSPSVDPLHKYMYVTSRSQHCVYRITIPFARGEVNVTAARAHFAKSRPWGPNVLVIGKQSGFADGNFNSAKFYMPSEVEVSADGKQLYVSDFGNHRIRVVDLKKETVTTLLGKGAPCWRTGSLNECPYAQIQSVKGQQPATYCNDEQGCASARNPLGVGIGKDALYVAMWQDDAVGVVDLKSGVLVRLCAFHPNLAGNVQGMETCKEDVLDRRGCFLYKPFDVVVSGQQLFVAVTNGITQIDLNTLECKQVGGKLWDWDVRTNSGYADGEVDPITGICSSLVYNPFKLVLAEERGIMYVADMWNRAIRRILVGGTCACPEGALYLQTARACYDPAEKWSAQQVIKCEEGFFALEGDMQCRHCADAFTLNLKIPVCMLWQERRGKSMGGYSFRKVATQPWSGKGDWFGISMPPPLSQRHWNDMFAEDGMLYSLHGENSVVVTVRQEKDKEWFVEKDPTKQPQQVLPGLWYPCQVSVSSDHCECSLIEVSFGTSGWQAAREAAVRGGARVLAENNLASFAKGEEGETIQGWSRFMLTTGEGVTPLQLHHERETVQDVPTRTTKARILQVNGAQRCYVGWPAHFTCPVGFVWAGPALAAQVRAQVMEPIMGSVGCVSCLEGTYSVIREEGGPYVCEPCLPGTYSSSKASTACTLCGNGTFAAEHGRSACSQCAPHHMTELGAESESQCNPCPPGSGNCTSCVPGYHQPAAAQGQCVVCPAGTVSTDGRAVECTRCPRGTYQQYQGHMTCVPCPIGSVAADEGATTCKKCNTSHCPLTVNETCGRGCGLNFFWNAEKHQCEECVVGSLNSEEVCAMSREACWKADPRKYYANGMVQICPDGQGPRSDKRGCRGCPTGTYYTAARGCVACGGGMFSDTEGATKCKVCSTGTYTPTVSNSSGYYLYTDVVPQGYSECLPCDEGTYGAAEGMSACSLCRAGTYTSVKGSRVCTLCGEGTWSSVVGQSMNLCQSCTGEHEYSGTGATACTVCENGMVSGAQCVGCGLGMYWDNDKCRSCGVGLVNLWNVFGNSTDCKRCPWPTAYAASDHAGCLFANGGEVPTADGSGKQECAAGTYRGENDTWTSTCLLCAPGTFGPERRQTECIPCQRGSYSNKEGKTECSQCVGSRVSTTVGSSACVPCSNGYQATDHNDECEPCPPYTAGEGVCDACLWPQPYAPAGASRCSECPAWTVFSGGVCEECGAGGYMQASEEGFMCLSCIGNTVNPHKGARSVDVCHACTGGYVRNEARTHCILCGDGEESINGMQCVPCGAGMYSRGNMSRCVACSAGTYTDQGGKNLCTPCEPGTYQGQAGASTCLLCPRGTFAAREGSRTCEPCSMNTFASVNGSIQCANRTQNCGMGYHLVSHTESAELNHECIQCQTCKETEVLVTSTQDFFYWESSTTMQQTMNPAVNPDLCPGHTFAPLYRCASNVPEAGFQIVSEMAGAAWDQGDVGMWALRRVPCEDLEQSAPGSTTRVTYVAGSVAGCFVGCKYGIQSGGLAAYYAQGTVGDKENPSHNIFYPRMASMWQQVCMECPQTACEWGKYRPMKENGCGPACGLEGCGDGCTGDCVAPPEGAQFAGGSHTTGVNVCPWVCMPGWHLSEEETGCRRCAESSDYCWRDYVLVDTERECFQTSKRSDLCKYCAPISGGRARGWRNMSQTCAYECVGGFYATDSTNTSCASCDGPWEECPVGTFRDIAGCKTNGTYPDCKPCSAPLPSYLFSFTSHGGSVSDNCSARCRAGFHSRHRSTGVYVIEGIAAWDLSCEACVAGDTRVCYEKCVPGRFRNMSVTNGLQEGACVACIPSADCGTGAYAPECYGNETGAVGCIPCDHQLLLSATGERVRQFVPYSLRKDMYKSELIQWQGGWHCPTVCLPNFVLVEHECVPCATWVKTQGCEAETKVPAAYANGQPRPCDFIFSHWNATPQDPWWNTGEFSPSFFHITTNQRAGICWACPYGEGTLEADADLCVLLPGYGRVSQEKWVKEGVKIPVWGKDIYIRMQNPTSDLMEVSNMGRRMLSASTDLQINMQCKVGYYKPSRGAAACSICPYGSSTVNTGAVSIKECVCIPGWRKEKTGRCVPCAVDTYIASFSNVNTSQCLPCPEHETTQGKKGSTACVCKRGWMRGQGRCQPCRANSYCRPCVGAEACPATRVIVTACFQGAVSPEGSGSVENCSCKTGSLALQRENGDLYCSELPPRAFYNVQTKKVACEAGWTARWDGSTLKGCVLCPMGQYAPLAQDGRTMLACQPCPRGSYSGTEDAIGGCTPCGKGLMTKQEGSVSVKECDCPPPTIRKGEGCVGCTEDEYSVNGACKPCPTFSKSSARNASECLCQRGYALRQGACRACLVGTFSSFVGNSECVPCSRGSTTLGIASESVRACSVCEEGYVWRDKVGCVRKTLVSA